MACQKQFLKWTSVGIAALLTIPLSSVSALTIVGMVKQHTRRALVPDLRVEATPERIARGKARADSFCGTCHSKSGTLTGGGDMSEDLLIPIGSFVPTNLTPAGPLKHWSDGEIFRAIRNGIGADGSWLVLMSYINAGRMSDDDTLAPTRAHRVWTGRNSRTLKRMGCSGGLANWRLRSSRRLTDRTPSEECSYQRPMANSGRWASRPCVIGSA